MKEYMHITTALIVLLLNLAVFSQGNIPEDVVTIKSIIGKAEVRPSTTGKWRLARIGMRVRMKWDVRTFVESSLELSFNSGTILKLGENSVVSLAVILADNKGGISKSNIKVGSGQLWSNVKKLVNKQSKFQFETPTAVAAIRGTSLGINVSNGKTIIDVYEGRVAVRSKGSKKEVVVSTRNRAVVVQGDKNIETISFDQITKQDSSGILLISNSLGLDTLIVDTTHLDSLVNDTSATDSIPIPDTILIDSNSVPEKEAVELELLLDFPNNGDKIGHSEIIIEGTATSGARIQAGSKSVIVGNSGKFSISYNLVSGMNQITILAELFDQVQSINLVVTYIPSKKLFLIVTKPRNGDVILRPEIIVTGQTAMNANIMVNNQNPQSESFHIVDSSKSFTTIIPIPDEAGEYSVIIDVVKGTESREIERIVTYNPPKEELKLILNSPVDNAKIETDRITVSGHSTQGARIEINADNGFSESVIVGSDGSFSTIINIYEQDIGVWQINITAFDEKSGNEKSVSRNIHVIGTSAKINVSIPTISLISEVQSATSTGEIMIVVTDKTPDDVMTLTATVNSVKEIFTIQSGDKERILLEDGKNNYTIIAKDLAKNSSNILAEEIYYLPGPIAIIVNEPDENFYNINDLPPFPGDLEKRLSLKFEIEIDDGIDDIPESIKYVQINGVNMKKRNDYMYELNVPILRGKNTFLIRTQDIAGNMASETINIQVNKK